MPPLSTHNEKVVDQHQQQAPGYARLTRSVSAEDRRARLRAMIDVQADDILLDVACGPGSLALDLAPYVARTIGFDITPAMLDQARKAQAERAVANIEWIAGDAANLPFDDGSFSIVASSAAFHHMEAPDRVLREMARVCRAGGRIVVIDVTPEEEKAASYDGIEHMRDPSHRHAHSVEELAALGARLGLGRPLVETSLTGPIPFEAILATSHPEECSREQLLEMMREDAASEQDRLGFRAELKDGLVLVTYLMSTLRWTKPPR